MTDTIQSSADLIDLTTDIVVAYLAKHPMGQGEIAPLISSVHAALGKLGQAEPEAAKPVPAVPAKKSVTPDYIISLEDGRRYKSLRRHLSARGLTPEEYRAKWGLPASYPMVAANYAKRRSELAKSMGLGRKAEAPARVTGKAAKAKAAPRAAGGRTKRR